MTHLQENHAQADVVALEKDRGSQYKMVSYVKLKQTNPNERRFLPAPRSKRLPGHHHFSQQLRRDGNVSFSNPAVREGGMWTRCGEAQATCIILTPRPIKAVHKPDSYRGTQALRTRTLSSHAGAPN